MSPDSSVVHVSARVKWRECCIGEVELRVQTEVELLCESKELLFRVCVELRII
jgi:hypothetical protein